jgi:cytochrome P450
MAHHTQTPLEQEINAGVFTAENLKCPYAIWAKMRAQCPVPRVSLGPTGQDAFLITRKEDLEFVATRPDLFRSEVDETVWRWGNDLGPEFKPIFDDGGYRTVHTIVTADPPAAHRYRAIVLEALSAKRVRERRPALQQIIDQLMADIPRGDREPFDLREIFCVPMPLLTILDIMGLPHADADLIYGFTCEALSLFDPSTPIPTALENARTLVKAQKYLAPRIEQYRQIPADNFLSFIACSRDENGALLSMEECLSIAFITIIGGNETSRNALTTAGFLLARDPALWTALRADPGKIEAFVDEAIRFGAPAVVTPRQVVQDTELAGVAMPKGAPVYMLWASGSHDERYFEAPEEIRLDRKAGRAHTSFGYGVHHCAGIHLARAELIMSVSTWLGAFESMELAVPADEIAFEPVWAIRAIGKLPVRVAWRKA